MAPIEVAAVPYEADLMTAITGADLTHAQVMNDLRLYEQILTNSPEVAPLGQVSVWDTVRHELIVAGRLRPETVPWFPMCVPTRGSAGQCRWRRTS